MNELIPLYCNNCNLPISIGMKCMKHEDGTILCLDCYQKFVLKPKERKTLKSHILRLIGFKWLYKWIYDNPEMRE